MKVIMKVHIYIYTYINKHSKCGEIIYAMNRMTKQRFSRSLLSLVIQPLINSHLLIAVVKANEFTTGIRNV